MNAVGWTEKKTKSKNNICKGKAAVWALLFSCGLLVWETSPGHSPRGLGAHPAAPTELKGKVLGEKSNNKGKTKPSFHSLIFLLFCGLPMSKGVFNQLQLKLLCFGDVQRPGQDSAWSWGTLSVQELRNVDRGHEVEQTLLVWHFSLCVY